MEAKEEETTEETEVIEAGSVTEDAVVSVAIETTIADVTTEIDQKDALIVTRKATLLGNALNVAYFINLARQPRDSNRDYKPRDRDRGDRGDRDGRRNRDYRDRDRDRYRRRSESGSKSKSRSRSHDKKRKYRKRSSSNSSHS